MVAIFVPNEFSTQWKAPVANEAALPVNTTVNVYSFTLENSSTADNFTDPAFWQATRFIATSDATLLYSITAKSQGLGGSGNTLTASIYTDNAGSPGVLVAVCDAAVAITAAEQLFTHYFTDLALSNGVTYWVVWKSPNPTGNYVGVLHAGSPPVAGQHKYTRDSGVSWDGGSSEAYVIISTLGINSYDGDARYAIAEKTVWVFDGTNWNQIGGTFSWNEDAATPHMTVNHAGITGVGSGAGIWTSLNNTVDATQNIQIDNVFASLITKLSIAAIDGNATPDMNYDIDIYTDAGRTALAYSAAGITSVLYQDLVPWEWFGGTSMYITVTNNKVADITDLDITIGYRR
jgi:hypothetical protein